MERACARGEEASKRAFEIVRQNLCEVTADAVVRFVSTGTGVRVLHRGSLPPGFMAKELEFAFTPKAVILIEVSLPQGGGRGI